MNKKYYYYVAILLRGKDMIHVKGTYSTTKDDFPLREVENHILENCRFIIDSIVISFYKEITENTYKSYSNEQ